ncbi:MAG: glycogen/starch/alpha-glucan phosphorylase, partial [Candidatus Sulfotelmatobacter sp.]
MSTKSMSRPNSAKVVPLTTKSPNITKLLQQYGTGEIPFAGTQDALYDRHLVFDRAIDPKVASARERFEAVSHAVRDVLAQRWVKTKTTYEQQNAKRIYYLSMEFLLGRSLTNNLTNLMLDPVMQEVTKEKDIDWPALVEQEPDAGLGNGGLGRLAACFLDSMATMQLPGTGYGLRYEYGMFRQSFVNGWQQENPDNWLRFEDPWEICRQHEKVDIKMNVTFKLRDGRVDVIPDRPSTLFGIPFDRPVVGYGGETINTLRLWAAAAADFFDFQEFGTGDFVGALGGTLEAESLTRVLYPDDSTSAGQQLRFVQEYFLVACSLADLIRRFLRHNSDWGKLPEKAAIQLNDTHPSMAVAELMRILLDDAHLGWDEAWDLTTRTLGYT